MPRKFDTVLYTSVSYIGMRSEDRAIADDANRRTSACSAALALRDFAAALPRRGLEYLRRAEARRAKLFANGRRRTVSGEVFVKMTMG